MGFAVGCCLNSPGYYSLFPISAPPCSSRSKFLNFFQRNTDNKRKNRSAIACMQNGDPNNTTFFCKRRAILFMGFSILPLLKLRTEAVEGSAAEDSEIRTQEQKENAEQAHQGDVSPNPSLVLLNGIGIFGSSVLGVLFTLAQKEKAGIEATLESMKLRLNGKEAAIVSLQKNLESELLNEKQEQNKQLKIANEERQHLINQFQSANSTITGLKQELKNEKRVVEGLSIQIDSLTTSLAKAGEDKEGLEKELKEKLNSVEVLQERINMLTLEINDREDSVRDLSSRLAAKESEFNKMSSIYEKNKNEVVGLNSDLKGLKDDLLKIESDLELKIAAVHDLNAQLSSLIVDRDDSNRKIGVIEKEYDELKLSTEKKAAYDAKFLEEREKKLHHLKEQLEIAVHEVSRKKVLVADLSRERDGLKKSLDGELKTVNNLEQELQLTQEALGKSENKVSDMMKQLQQSRNLCSQLNAEISKVRAESAEAMESLQRNLVVANQSAEDLAGELTASHEALKQTKEAMQTVSGELAATVENGENLNKELVDVYEKAESAVQDLKEEKKIVTCLNEELRALECRIIKDMEARISLERDLEVSTKSLDEMNQNRFILSRNLELANSQISSLQDEKDVYYESLAEQKQLTREAKENLEDAHNLVMRLGKERERLEKKSKKLEEEVASAKGEILRLRSQIKASVNHVDQKRGVEASNATVPAKKTTRKKKGCS